MLDAQTDISWRNSLDRPPNLGSAVKMEMLTAALRNKDGVSPVSIMMHGIRAPGKLTINEIFYYRLLDGDLSVDELKRWVGKKGQARFHNKCNDIRWFASCHDKAFFYTSMRGAGFSTPETVALAFTSERRGYAACIDDATALAEFLAANTDWPLFAKPIDGIFSVGALKIMGAERGMLTLHELGEVPASDVASYMQDVSGSGYMLQRFIAPNDFASKAFSDALPTVRMLVLFGEATPSLESAVVKIPRRGAIADNYWRAGNLLGALDLETGEIIRAVSGAADRMATHDCHPDTGVTLIGLKIPNWSDVVECALAAATMFPGIRTQSWDIALSSEGPLPLELNFGGDLNLHQLAYRRGALTDRYAAHLARCGLKVSIG